VPGLKIADATQVLTIDTADVETAELLNIPINAPIARITRTATSGDGTVIFVGEGLYRGDIIRLQIKLK
jgi:GntR family transcriptional regulator